MSLVRWVGWITAGFLAGFGLKKLVAVVPRRGRPYGTYETPLTALAAGFLIGSMEGSPFAGRRLGSARREQSLQ